MRNTIFILLFCACASTGHAQNTSNACLKELKRDANKYWRYNEKTKRYTGSDTLIKKLFGEYQTCLIGKDTSFFLKIFGRQNISRRKNNIGGSITYPIYPEIKGLWKLDVKFDKKGKIKYVVGETMMEKTIKN